MSKAIYTMTIQSGYDQNIYDGGTTYWSIARTGGDAPPGNAYVYVTKETISYFACLCTGMNRAYQGVGSNEYYGQTGIEFGDTHYSGSIIRGNHTGVKNTVLSVGSTPATIALTAVALDASGTQCFRFTQNSTIVWEVEWYIQTYVTASTATYTNPVEAGDDITISFANAYSSILDLQHEVTLSIGSYSKTEQLPLGTASMTTDIPLSWLNAIPNALSGTCNLKLTTYNNNGGLIGSRAYTFILQVPDDVVPVVGTIVTERIDNTVPSTWGIYVQNKSGIRLTASNWSGAYGSVIQRYSISGGMEATQTSNVFELSTLPTAGPIVFNITAWDSRGRPASSSVTISVESYASPVINAADAVRCTGGGTHQTDGTYIAASMTATTSSCDSKNSKIMTVSYRQTGASTWTSGGTQQQGVEQVFGGGNIAEDKSYEVKFVVSDSFTSVEKIVTVGVAFYTLYFKNGGLSVGVGMVSTRDSAMEINGDWTILHGGNIVPTVIYSSSQPATGTAGMIWLKPVS